MTRAAFERLLVEAVALIPKRFRREIKNLALVVEDEPSLELLDEMEIEPPDTLYGLYQGTPLTERTWQYGNTLPDRITLFQRPIEEDCDDEDDVRAVIGETLIHEVGHYFGMSEEEIEDIEERYWRGRVADDEEVVVVVHQLPGAGKPPADRSTDGANQPLILRVELSDERLELRFRVHRFFFLFFTTFCFFAGLM